MREAGTFRGLGLDMILINFIEGLKTLQPYYDDSYGYHIAVHGGWTQAPAMYKMEADCLAVMQVLGSYGFRTNKCIKAEVVKP
jgi:hypothetical protein